MLSWYVRARVRLSEHVGQTTAEYALVILAAAAIAVVLIAWARSSGRLPRSSTASSIRSRAVRVRSDLRRGPERGAATVEFALVLPVVFLVRMAVVQVVAIGRDRLLLAQAARAGAREASVQESTDAVLEAARAAAPELDPARLRVEVSRAGERGLPVTVSIEYGVSVAGALAGWLLPTSVTLRASVTARQEFG